MHITADEFWDLTPIEFKYLMDRHLEELERQDRLFSIMPTIYINSNRGKGKPARKFEDFILHNWRGKTKASQKPEDMLTFVRTLDQNLKKAKNE